MSTHISAKRRAARGESIFGTVIDPEKHKAYLKSLGENEVEAANVVNCGMPPTIMIRKAEQEVANAEEVEDTETESTDTDGGGEGAEKTEPTSEVGEGAEAESTEEAEHPDCHVPPEPANAAENNEE